jgi:hypothetical protein
MTQAAKAQRRDSLEATSDRELMTHYLREHDYVARDLLASRRVLVESTQSAINDYAHHVAAMGLGARRIGGGSNRGRGPSRHLGICTADFKHFLVRAHVRAADRTARTRFSVNTRDRAYHGLVLVVFTECLHVDEAWLLPWPVVETYTTRSGISLPGGWIEDDRVRPLNLGNDLPGA